MRIGIMLRAHQEKGGVGVYTRNITKHLIEAKSSHYFVLYVADGAAADHYSCYQNVEVRHIKVASKVIWDQVAVPYWFRRDKLDAIFHPKFTVPLLCGHKGAMVLHGAGWFIPETRKYWHWSTRLYARLMMPVYCRVAGAVIAVSNITREVFVERLGISPDKIQTIYFAPGKQFNERVSEEQMDTIRAKFDLPKRFIFTISGGDRDDRKNFGAILEAFRLVHERAPCALVVAGRGCEQFRERYEIPCEGYGKDIHFPGWVDQAELPAFYQAASCFVYPSNMEAFPIPVTEALSSGTPLITSEVYGLRELAGDAGLLVDPADSPAIADAILRLQQDSALRQQLAERAQMRAKLFDWDQCAAQTLEVIERIGRS